MYEVEIKVRAAHEPVRDRLDEIGATRVETVRQVDVYYDAPHRDFAATDEALRLRDERPLTESDAPLDAPPHSRTLLTYKGPLVEAASKTRTEAETPIAEPAALREILAALGFDPAYEVRKTRERYETDGYAVTLDDVDELGSFVEVEIDVQTDIEPAREGAFAVLRALDLDPDDQLRTSYLGLLIAEHNDR